MPVTHVVVCVVLVHFIYPDVLAHMNIWQFDDLAQLSILPLLLTGTPATAVSDTATTLAAIQQAQKPAAEQQQTLTASTSNPALHEQTTAQAHAPVTPSHDAAATLENTIYVYVQHASCCHVREIRFDVMLDCGGCLS